VWGVNRYRIVHAFPSGLKIQRKILLFWPDLGNVDNQMRRWVVLRYVKIESAKEEIKKYIEQDIQKELEGKVVWK